MFQRTYIQEYFITHLGITQLHKIRGGKEHSFNFCEKFKKFPCASLDFKIKFSKWKPLRVNRYSKSYGGGKKQISFNLVGHLVLSKASMRHLFSETFGRYQKVFEIWSIQNVHELVWFMLNGLGHDQILWTFCRGPNVFWTYWTGPNVC